MKRSLLILLASLVACTGQRTKLLVTNQSAETIDSVLVQPDRSASKRYFRLSPGESQAVTISLKGLGDGAYGILYKTTAGRKIYTFGYFSNGGALEENHRITIKADTVLFKAD